MILSHRCKTGASHRRDRSADSRAAGALRDVEQNAATRQIEVSRAFAKTEESVRAEPHQSSIRESKLGARVVPRSHGRARADVVVYRCWTWCAVRCEQSHIVNHLSDTSFFLVGRDRECGRSNRNSEGERDPDGRNAIMKPFLHTRWNP